MKTISIVRSYGTYITVLFLLALSIVAYLLFGHHDREIVSMLDQAELIARQGEARRDSTPRIMVWYIRAHQYIGYLDERDSGGGMDQFGMCTLKGRLPVSGIGFTTVSDASARLNVNWMHEFEKGDWEPGLALYEGGGDQVQVVVNDQIAFTPYWRAVSLLLRITELYRDRELRTVEVDPFFDEDLIDILRASLPEGFEAAVRKEARSLVNLDDLSSLSSRMVGFREVSIRSFDTLAGRPLSRTEASLRYRILYFFIMDVAMDEIRKLSVPPEGRVYMGWLMFVGASNAMGTTGLIDDPEKDVPIIL